MNYKHHCLMQMMIAVTAKLQILYPFIFYSCLTNYCSNMHKIWWTGRSMGLLTTHQKSTQPDTVDHPNNFIYQNCSVLKWQQTETDKISLKSDVLLNQYSNQLEASTCPKWGMRSPKFEAIPTTFESLIAGLKITNFCITKAGQISCSPFSLLHTLRCVFCTL